MYEKKEMKPAMSPSKKYKQESMEDIAEYQILGVKGQFNKQAAEFFGIRTAVSTEDGTSRIASYYPYYNQANKLVGYKKRDWTVPKEDDWHFTTVGKVSASCKMFGQHKYDTSPKVTIVVEGEGDVCAAWYTITEHLKKINRESTSVGVVGLPAGAVNAEQAASANEKFLLGGQELILALDNDERLPGEKKNVKRGKEATEDIFKVLLSDKIKKVNWKDGEDAKDAATAAWLAEDIASFYKKIVYGGEVYLGSNIVKPSHFSFKELIAQKPLGIMLKCFPKLMMQIRGIRKNELTVVTGESGAGKSTVTSEIVYSLAEEGQKVGIIFLEEDTKESVQRMMARHIKKNFNRFKFDPTKEATMEELEEAYRFVTEDDRFTLVDHFGSLLTEDLMDKIRQMVFIDKVDYIVLDHITMVLSGNATKDERKDIDILMTNLAAFVVPNDVGIIAISHLNRTGTAARQPKVNEDEAFWKRVRKEDLRGSAALEQLAFNIWGVEVEVKPDRKRGRVRIVNLKNRPCGIMGEADVLRQDEDTGILETAEDEVI